MRLGITGRHPNKNSHIIATYEYTKIDGTNSLRLRKVYRLPKAIRGPGRLARPPCLAYDFSKAPFIRAIDNFCITYFGNDMAVLPNSYSRGAFYVTIR